MSVATTSIKTCQTGPDGLRIESSRGWLTLTPYSAHSVRVRYSLRAELSARPSLVVVARPDENVPFSVHETARSLLFSTAQLSIEVDKATLALTYRDSTGRTLTREPARGGKTLTPVDVELSVFDASGETQTVQSVDGIRVRAQNVRKRIDRQAYHTKLEFEWAEGEALYGLGSHEEGMFNLRGQHQHLYQQNMKAVVPVLVSTHGYGILLDSCSLMTFHDDAFGSYLWTEVDDELDFYFIYGPELDQVVAGIRRLTGRPPMLPRWAFGYIQSKERYTSQDELVQIVREYRDRGLPLDCVVLDWKSWTADLWGQKSLDPQRFPDPDAMMEQIHALNARLMVSIWPTMRQGGANWNEMRQRGFLLGNQATYNAFDAEARALYWQQTNEGLFAHGVDAWWCDATEPFESDWQGAVKPEPEERLQINTAEARLYLDPEYINAYSLLHSQGIYEGQRKLSGDKRVVNLTRSAYPGQQRYSTITWSGDIAATWDTLRKQVAEGLNFCITGLPYWTVDIGAFFVKNRPELWFWSGDYEEGVDDLGYRELYVRWFQYAAFLPMFRSHGTDTPREVWRFGEPGDLMYDTLAKFLRLRYRLLPYIYSLAGWTTHQDYTLLRALPFDFREDARTYGIRDQFMLGPALLVCPVTQPMYYAAGSVPLTGVAKGRPVYLPAGSDWYDFWTGRRLAGGQTVFAEASLDRLPLYVRAGAILLLGPAVQYADEMAAAPHELRIYAGRDGSFVLYEDEGDNYNYEQGAFSQLVMRWQDAERRLILEERTGSFPGMAECRTFRVLLAGEEAGPDPAEGCGQVLIYEGKRVVIDL